MPKPSKDSAIMPPCSESPFGAFPSDYTKPPQAKSQSTKKSLGNSVRHTADAQPTTAFLQSHTGSGGLTASTLKGASASPKAAAGGENSGPGKAGAFNKQKIVPTEFRRYYERGDLPISIQHRSNGRTISWKVDVEKLDYHHYLPIFFDGLRELEEPFKFIAMQGCFDLLEIGRAHV